MRGKWVTFDPREWSNQYDVSINVGLGNGNRQEQIAMLQMIMAKQEEIIGKYGANNPLVTPSQYRSTLGKMIEMAGFKDTTAYINEITPELEQQIMQMASQPPADPTSEAAQMYAQVEKAKAELRAQTDNAKNEIDREKNQLEAQRKDLELQQKASKDEAELKIQEAKLALQAIELEIKKNASEANIQTSQMDTVMKSIKDLQDLVNSGMNGG